MKKVEDTAKLERYCTNLKNAQKLQRKLTILITLMTLSFYITWLPYAINCLLAMSGVILPHAANVIAILFAKSGTVINPILYIFFNKEVSNLLI